MFPYKLYTFLFQSGLHTFSGPLCSVVAALRGRACSWVAGVEASVPLLSFSERETDLESSCWESSLGWGTPSLELSAVGGILWPHLHRLTGSTVGNTLGTASTGNAVTGPGVPQALWLQGSQHRPLGAHLLKSGAKSAVVTYLEPAWELWEPLSSTSACTGH